MITSKSKFTGNRFSRPPRVDSRYRPSRNDDRPRWPAEATSRKGNTTVMSQIVMFFAAMNRPSKQQPVGQYKAHTTNEEMMGLL